MFTFEEKMAKLEDLNSLGDDHAKAHDLDNRLSLITTLHACFHTYIQTYMYVYFCTLSNMTFGNKSVGLLLIVYNLYL